MSCSGARRRPRRLPLAARGLRLCDACDASAAAIVVLAQSGDHADAAMAEIDQIIRRPGRGGGIVEADAGTLARQAEGLHHRDAVPGNAGMQIRMVDVPDQHQPVDAALQQEGRLAQLVFQVVAGIGRDQGVAGLAQPVLEARQDAHERLVLDVGHHGAHRHEPAGRERPGGAIGHEAQILRGAHHGLALVGPDSGRAVEYPGDRRGRDSGTMGHVPRHWAARERFQNLPRSVQH
jgi:hypothetical protein